MGDPLGRFPFIFVQCVNIHSHKLQHKTLEFNDVFDCLCFTVVEAYLFTISALTFTRLYMCKNTSAKPPCLIHQADSSTGNVVVLSSESSQ